MIWTIRTFPSSCRAFPVFAPAALLAANQSRPRFFTHAAGASAHAWKCSCRQGPVTCVVQQRKEFNERRFRSIHVANHTTSHCSNVKHNPKSQSPGRDCCHHANIHLPRLPSSLLSRTPRRIARKLATTNKVWRHLSSTPAHCTTPDSCLRDHLITTALYQDNSNSSQRSAHILHHVQRAHADQPATAALGSCDAVGSAVCANVSRPYCHLMLNNISQISLRHTEQHHYLHVRALHCRHQGRTPRPPAPPLLAPPPRLLS